MRARLLLAPIVLAALACSDPSSPEFDEVPADAVALVASAFSDFDEALDALRYFSGHEDRARLVIRDDSTWARVWRRAANSAPSQSLPPVDFELHMIIFAAMGGQRSTGYGIEIEQLYRRGEDIYAVVRETSPGDRCLVGHAITAPVTAALVPRTRGRVHFVERTSIRACGR